MKKIIKKIKSYQIRQNLIEIISFLSFSAVLLLLLIQLFSIISLFYPQNIIENYWISQILKFSWITITLWLAMKFEKRLLNAFKSANIIDRTCNQEDDTVTNAYEMITNPPSGNKAIIELYLQQSEEKIEKLNPVFNFVFFKKSLLYLFILLLSMSLQLFITGSSSWEAYQKFFNHKKPSAVFHQPITLSPGNIDIAKGASVQISVNNVLERAEYSILYRFEDMWREESMLDAKKTFSNLDKSFSYFVKNQWVSSDTFRVNVLDDPNVRRISLKYLYPAYINKKADYIENSDGIINVPQFTEIEMLIQTPETVREANLVFSDRNFIKMDNEGRDTWQTRFTPKENLYYHFSLIDELGTKNQVVNRSINIIKDEAPSIAFIYPAKDTVMTQNNLFEVRLTASDDYGLKNLKIFYHINQNPVVDSLLFRETTLNFVNRSHIFDFRNNPLFPGDEVTYWAEIYDNSPLQQKAETQRFKLRFPSIEDIFRDLEKQEEEKTNILTKAFEEVQELKKEFDMKRREMLRKDEMNWDDQKALEKFIEDQKALNEMVENVASNYDKMIEQMQQNEAVSQEILEKMQKIQEIMEQISTDDLKRAMEQMQQSLEKLNPEDVKQAMENFQFKMEDFAEKLEQTLKLLQDIKNEQNLEKALEIAKEMQKMQEEILRQTEKADDTSSLSDDQQRIEDKLNALKEQMQKTIDDMKNSKDKNTLQEMQDLMQDMQDSQLSEKLQESSQSLQKNQKDNAMEKQKQSLSQMSKMISKMEEMKSNMSGAGMQQMMEAIQMTIYRLLMISREHDNKVKQIGNDPVPFTAAFINDFESVQIAIQQLYQAPQVLLFLGQKFFNDLNFTINSYRSYFSDIQNSRFHNHKKHTSDIQAGINLLIFDLMQAQNQMQQGGEGGGSGGMQSLMQQLEQMSGQQMAMNAMTQSILEQMSAGGNRISNQMRQQLQDIAAEEQRLADNLKRMMQTNPEAQKHSSALNEITNELDDIARKIRQNRIDRNLIEQQNRIMSRLIEVQRSINKRDKSNQRKGDSAQEKLWDLPPDLDLNFKNATERKALEDEIQKLPLEYRQIILEYLRKINE